MPFVSLFLLFRIPGLWEKVDFTKSKGSEPNLTGGAAAIVCGMLTLVIPTLVSPTHTINGVNYGEAFDLTTTGLGFGLVALGISMLFKTLKSLHMLNQTQESKF